MSLIPLRKPSAPTNTDLTNGTDLFSQVVSLEDSMVVVDVEVGDGVTQLAAAAAYKLDLRVTINGNVVVPEFSVTVDTTTAALQRVRLRTDPIPINDGDLVVANLKGDQAAQTSIPVLASLWAIPASRQIVGTVSGTPATNKFQATLSGFAAAPSSAGYFNGRVIEFVKSAQGLVGQSRLIVGYISNAGTAEFNVLDFSTAPASGDVFVIKL